MKTEPYRRNRLTESQMRDIAEHQLMLAKQRRSVRMFSDEPVSRDLVEKAIAAACSAPSGANQQPWTFVLIGDAEVKRRIREGAEAEEREFYDHRAPAEWLEALAPIGTDAEKPFLETAPWLIIVFRVNYRMKGEKRIKTYYGGESVGIAVGMLLSALNHMGLATLTHTPAPMGFLNEICGRPENEKPFVLIPVGYPADDCEVPVLSRRPISEMMVVMDGAGGGER